MTPTGAAPRVPPRWFVTTAWKVHRGLIRVSRARWGLWTPASKRGWGALRLTTMGRTSGEPRPVIVAYLDDGEDLSIVAMNGWGEGHPAWWRNLQAHPDATVRVVRSPERAVRAREAQGEERDRLWARWVGVDESIDRAARARTTPTPVILLEPR